MPDGAVSPSRVVVHWRYRGDSPREPPKHNRAGQRKYPPSETLDPGPAPIDVVVRRRWAAGIRRGGERERERGEGREAKGGFRGWDAVRGVSRA
jgi:hypothetical protein